MRIYVGNLSYNTTEEQIKTLFAGKGQVESVTVIMDKYTGRSKGFGFVEMANDEEAKAAIDALNGTEFEGRRLTVSEARAREGGPERGRSQGPGPRGPGHRGSRAFG